jgi:hypothetical protein
MGGKNSYGPFNPLQGGIGAVVADPPNYIAVTAESGGSEPSWPTTEYATVTDGGMVWTAIFARTVVGTVNPLGMINSAIFQHGLVDYPDHYFQYGTITWLTGGNTGLSSAVRDSLGASAGIPYIFCLEKFPNAILPGDTFEATVGCAKIRLSCQQFNNLDNHRAFPDMPTEERALATPNISSQGYAPRQTK